MIIKFWQLYSNVRWFLIDFVQCVQCFELGLIFMTRMSLAGLKIRYDFCAQIQNNNKPFFVNLNIWIFWVLKNRQSTTIRFKTYVIWRIFLSVYFLVCNLVCDKCQFSCDSLNHDSWLFKNIQFPLQVVFRKSMRLTPPW